MATLKFSLLFFPDKTTNNISVFASRESRPTSQRFLTMTLGEELFAIDIFSVREILDFTDITRIPQTPDFMRGVVNVRGSAVPVIDLNSTFGDAPTVQVSYNTLK